MELETDTDKSLSERQWTAQLHESMPHMEQQDFEAERYHLRPR